MLSLATGFYAVISAVVFEPAKSKADAQAKLHDTLAQIVSLDQELLREVPQGDPNANNGTLESKRNILLQQAEDLASKGVASAEDQLNLGNEYEFGRRLELALTHFKAALQVAGKDSLMKSAADTRIGKLDFYGISGSTPQEGRRYFEDAENVLSKPASMQAGIALVQSLGIRSWVECSFGDPALGQKARARATAELALLAKDPAVSPQLVDTLKVGPATGLNNTHCAEDAASASQASPAISRAGAAHAEIPKNKIDLSNQMIQLLVARNYTALEANMTATVQSQVPESRLQAIWEGLAPQLGPYKRTLETKTSVVNNATFYVVHAQCEKALVNLALAFDQANRVSFILITPLSALPKQQIEQKASEVASEFFQQEFGDVFSGFDPGLKSQLPMDRLQSVYMQVTNALGHFDHVVAGVKDQNLDIVDVLCQMQGGKAVIRVAFDPDMKINTFFIALGK